MNKMSVYDASLNEYKVIYCDNEMDIVENFDDNIISKPIDVYSLKEELDESQLIQDKLILETDIRILEIELMMKSFTFTEMNLCSDSKLRNSTYFNFIKKHIENKTYEKEYLENVISKYLEAERLTQEEYCELYKLLQDF